MDGTGGAAPELRRDDERAVAALARLPWLLVAGAVVLPLLLQVSLPIAGLVWRALVMVAGLVAGFVGWRRHGLPAVVMVATSVTAFRIAGFHAVGQRAGYPELAYHHAVADVVVGLSLVLVLAIISHTRRRHPSRQRDAVDIVAVLTGGSLVAWLLMAEPLVDEHGTATWLAVLSGAYLPISLLVLVFVVDALLQGLTSNRSMILFAVAAVIDLVASTLNALHYTVFDGAMSHAVVQGLHLSAFLLFAAGIVHPAVVHAIEPVRREQAHLPGRPRLAIMVVSFAVPAVLVATLPATDGLDRAVRIVGTTVLMALAGFRLHLATRDDERARRALIERLHRDELTGLPTRAPFVDRVNDLLEETWRSERHPTIIQLNLDRFKNINDSLGHADANHVLATVARRLAEAAAELGETAMAARAGGDDFVLVDGSTVSIAEALDRVATIRDVLAEPIHVGESNVFVTASIGVAVAPNRTISADELLRRADIATHTAKDDGRNRVSVFDDSMQARLARRMDVEHALHGAIGRREMRLYHQPIVDTITGDVTGFEALMRWQRGEGTPVSPLDFIPIAEETGLICELGAWALRDALGSLRRWIDDGVVGATTTMSVNVSPRQVADPHFAGIVMDAVAQSGVPAHLLWLEITESMMLEEPELARSTLHELRSKGVRIAIDDFGTGFSSLSLLQRFPIQRIKIDRAFVQGISEDGNDRSLVRTIVAMARSMGFDVVAEGTETVEQLEALRDLGCDKAQGFLISRPVPADAMGSTMLGLSQLTELSLFSSTASPASTARVRLASPTDAASPTRTVHGPAATFGVGPMGMLATRPLGHPRS